MNRPFGVVALTLAAACTFAQTAKTPRTPDGKPDFSGVYEWPKASSGERCRCSATIFDKTKFPPFKPGGELFFEPRNGDRFVARPGAGGAIAIEPERR